MSLVIRNGPMFFFLSLMAETESQLLEKWENCSPDSAGRRQAGEKPQPELNMRKQEVCPRFLELAGARDRQPDIYLYVS